MPPKRQKDPPFSRTGVRLTPIETLYLRARTNPNSVAFSVGDDRWNYRWLAVQAERLARGLTARGVQKGNRIALHMLKRPELVVAVYGCFHVGAIAVPLSRSLKEVDLKPLVEQLRPSLYIGDASACGEMNSIDWSILPRVRRFFAGEAKEENGLQRWASLLNDVSDPAPVVADLDSPALLITHWGTAGGPRFAIHNHRTLAAVFGLPFMCD